VTLGVHPLCGQVLRARSFRRLQGELMLAVVLADGSVGTIPAAATDVFGEEERSEQAVATVLSVDGVRRLRALLAAKSRGSQSRGTRRRAA
jgi:hypothetical protein